MTWSRTSFAWNSCAKEMAYDIAYLDDSEKSVG